ncbi:MAG: P-loop NTPase fold protein [Candidatus Acidiferrales bacterium]|jgi:predicted KAP-like P-loop ATPase
MNSGPSSIHVWQDNETDVDLLGFQVHADLIRSVITDPTVLPVTVGVFGDWGGGKSSIMKMLQKELSNEDSYPTVVCLYFNGWTFEGYEDAKSALLSSILIQLGEHKRFGPKAKDLVVKLLKRLKWMEVAKLAVKHVGIPVAVVAATGGLAAVPVAAAVVAGSIVSSSLGKTDGSDVSTPDINWSALVEASPEKPDLMGVRKFRDEFSKMLEKTEISALVVLIDDLDRCLPERLIETLEAIKLFVSVPRTAFVIGADPRIVRHAISTRYVKRHLQNPTSEEASESRREEESLVQDYLEKLIQVPYQLPRLSPSEIETYINLLACEKLLDKGQSATVLTAWRETRAQNVYAAFTADAIQKSLKLTELPTALKEQLDWSTAVASVITEGLKGNPRQVKRMLNAMSLRKQLATVARISIKEEVLAKLMVLEYSNLPLFQELNQWQAGEKGVPDKIRTLEEQALGDGEAQKISTEDGLSKWRTPSVFSWLRMRPPLSGEDLRDYFWLARDRTGSTLTGITMIPPNVQLAVRRLLSDNAGEKALGAKATLLLSEQERTSLFDLLKLEAERHPDRAAPVAALHTLAIQKVPGAAPKLIETARSIPAASLLPSVPQNIAELALHDADLRSSALDVLREIATHEKTKAGKAATSALASLAKKV